MRRLNLEGQKFGRLTFIRYEKSVNKVTFALFKCDCGNLKVINTFSVKKGRTQSCGCFMREKQKEGNPVHGLCHHPLFKVWRGIIDRCTLTANDNYHLYGGRGITMCAEWREDFKTFYNWAVSNNYNKGLQIDRIDNNGNYEPDNCRFVTPKENAYNRRTNRYITANGETKTLKQWSDNLGISMCCIFNRLKNGWSEEKAISTPLLRERKIQHSICN